jgi:N-hydroxyarylamine O-acetyltransferase
MWTSILLTFARRAADGPRDAITPSPESLATLMRAHVYRIPFENLDAVCGRAPSLELDDLVAKMVRGGRGGYCYEHNSLFHAVLRELGFRVSTHAARVVLGAREGMVRPRTHMILFVHFDDGPYLTDVGFGAPGCLLAPAPLIPDAEIHDTPRRHRLTRTAGEGPLPQWTLQARLDGVWVGQYTFTEEVFQAPDYQVFNWYVATHPRSPFHLAPYVLRNGPGRHLELDGRTLTERPADGPAKVRTIDTDDELVHVLRSEFDIDVPAYFPKTG